MTISSIEKTANYHRSIGGTPPKEFDGQADNLSLFDIVGPQKTAVKLNLLISMYKQENDPDEQTKLFNDFLRSVEYLEERGYKPIIEEDKITRLEKISI